jgi:hypothetical protein
MVMKRTQIIAHLQEANTPHEIGLMFDGSVCVLPSCVVLFVVFCPFVATSQRYIINVSLIFFCKQKNTHTHTHKRTHTHTRHFVFEGRIDTITTQSQHDWRVTRTLETREERESQIALVVLLCNSSVTLFLCFSNSEYFRQALKKYLIADGVWRQIFTLFVLAFWFVWFLFF